MNANLLLKHFDRVSDAPDSVPRLRQFVLNLAVRGKLVEQDPTEKTFKPQTNGIPIVEPGDEPFKLPSRWQWVRLGHIANWGSGSTPPRGNLDFFGGGITWLKSGELNDNQQLSGSEETVTPLALTNCSFRQNQPGDLLLAMYGATIGKAAILAEPAVTNQAVCGCTPLGIVFNRFLFYFLLSNRDQFRSASEGGAQPNISKVKIVNSPAPLPPLGEQHRIVAKVDQLFEFCDELDQQIQSAHIDSGLLLKGVLHSSLLPAAVEAL